MFTNFFDAPNFVLNDEQMAQTLPRISLTFQSDRSKTAWVDSDVDFKKSICQAAGMDWQALLQASSTPYLCVELNLELATAYISRCIYPVTLETFSNEYYLWYIPELGRLLVKYQRIIGSRVLGKYNPVQQKELFDQLVAQATILKDSQAYADILVRAAKVAAEVAQRNAKTTSASTLEISVSALAQSASESTLAQLALMTANGDSLMLPSEHMSEYAKIKRLLETAGAKYVARKMCFTFPGGKDAQRVLDQLLQGTKVNPKKEFQFFASTEPVVQLMRSQLPADLTGLDVLEPSAGDGVLADMAKGLGANVTTVELWDLNVKALKDKGYTPHERDFLEMTETETGLFDIIVANPPFSRGLDIEHFMHMTKFLKPGGRLCCVMSTAWQTGTNRKQAEFREFVDSHVVDVDSLPPGTFKESGTDVGAVLLTFFADEATNVVTKQAMPEAELV